MAVAVDRERAQAFERDGFLSGIRVCSDAKADEIRRQFDALEAVEGRERCQIGLLDRHLDQRFVWGLATHPAIVEWVAAVLGPDVMLLATHFFCQAAHPRAANGDRAGGDRDGTRLAVTIAVGSLGRPRGRLGIATLGLGPPTVFPFNQPDAVHLPVCLCQWTPLYWEVLSRIDGTRRFRGILSAWLASICGTGRASGEPSRSEADGAALGVGTTGKLDGDPER
jgi:hypothetical protein